MTQPKDFDKVIQERLRSLGRRSKTVLKTKRPPKKSIRPEEPVNDLESLPDSDEEVDKDKATKRAQKKNDESSRELKSKRKHLNGYVSKTGRGKKK